jgi:nucleoside-diphosphate-sugar epimerase
MANLHKASVPLVHAEDVARAALHLADPTQFNGEAYNVVDDNSLDMIDTLKLVAALCDSDFRVFYPIYPLKLIYPLLWLVAQWSTLEAKLFRGARQKRGKPLHPKIELDTLNYMFGNFHFSNAKLKAAGFEFKWGDRRLALPHVIDWYERNGWEPRPGGAAV